MQIIGTNGSFIIRKELNSHRIGLGHQCGRRFIVLEHQYGRCGVMFRDAEWVIRESSVQLRTDTTSDI